MEKNRGSVSRRNMLIVAGGALAAVGALIAAPYRAIFGRRPSQISAVRPSALRTQSLASAGYSEWTEQVGATFAVAGAQGLSLAGVRPLDSAGRRPTGVRDRAFVAVFDVLGGGTMAGDLIYTVSHPEFGPFRLFLSVADARTPSRMLAIFN